MSYPRYSSHEATVERLLRSIHRNQYKIMSALNLTINMEIEQMADFAKLIAEVEATRGAAESTRIFVEGLEAKIADVAADMNDEDDQAKVEELASQLAKIRESLPKAVAANPGGSTGGITETAVEPTTGNSG